MTLTELQLQLREIENRISTLQNEIENMKPKPEEEKLNEFEKITNFAKQNVIRNSKLEEAFPEIKECIIKCLSYISCIEDKGISLRLLYICRLANGSGYDISAEELYRKGIEFEKDDLKWICEELENYIEPDFRYTLLVESFIVAGITGNTTQKMLSCIADLATMLKCDQEEICYLSTMAKSLLIGDLDYILQVPLPRDKRWKGKLREFLSDKWIVKQRYICAILCIEKYYGTKNDDIFKELWSKQFDKSKTKNDSISSEKIYKINKKLKSGTIVKKGQVICEWKEKMLGRLNDKKNIITAPCNGVLYYMTDKRENRIGIDMNKYVAIYVISYFDKPAELCSWYKDICRSKGITDNRVQID